MSRIIELGEKHYTTAVGIISDSHPAKVLLLHHRKTEKMNCFEDMHEILRKELAL